MDNTSNLIEMKGVINEDPSIFEKPYQCNICKRKFEYKCILEIHQLQHAGEWPFRCPYCNNGFPARINLIIHMYKHSDEKPFFCRYCNIIFATKSSFQHHMTIHSNQLYMKFHSNGISYKCFFLDFLRYVT